MKALDEYLKIFFWNVTYSARVMYWFSSGGRDGWGCLGKIDEARPQSHRESYIRRIASLTSRYWCNGRFRLSIPTVSVRVSSPLDREIEFRLSTRPYTPLYPACRLRPACCQRDFRGNPINHHRVASTFRLPPFPVATTTDFSGKSEMPVRDVLIHSAYRFLYVFRAPFC